jgi:hypothetical protein
MAVSAFLFFFGSMNGGVGMEELGVGPAVCLFMWNPSRNQTW